MVDFQNENCRVAFCENQQWQVVVVLFGLVTCSVPLYLKAEIFRVLAAFGRTPDIAVSLWHTLEASQVRTIHSKLCILMLSTIQYDQRKYY